MIDDDEALNIYTDGSSLPHPRRGGIGVRFVFVDLNGDEEIYDFDFPGYKEGTSNEMELLACITGIKEAPGHPAYDRFEKIAVYTDSQYVRDHLKDAIYKWPNNRWLKSTDAPVLNVDLWKQLARLYKGSKKKISIIWVKGHSKNKHNRAVDKLAKKSANMPLNEPLTVRSVRRKITQNKTEIGSVGIEGQRITIRIDDLQYLKHQKLYRYRYEVMSKKSPYYKNTDRITSKILLRDGHKYYVRLNDNSSNPQILKIFRVID